MPDPGGEDQDHINSLDANSVALAAIQALYQRSQEACIAQLEAENAALHQQPDALAAQVAVLERGGDTTGFPLQSGLLPGTSGLPLSLGLLWLNRKEDERGDCHRPPLTG